MNNCISTSQILEKYNLGQTIVLHTNKDTLIFKKGITCCVQIEDVLNSGMYKHNELVKGRIL